METNKRVTAVEWLVEQLKDMEYDLRLIPNTIEQAKAMEKEQIIESAERLKWVDYSLVKSGEDYYNETYGKSNT
jgi:hypothetical protein